MKLVKNLELNRVIVERLSVNISKKLRPAQLMGQRLRQADNNPNIQIFLQQKRLENREREQEDWTNNMSSKTLYR